MANEILDLSKEGNLGIGNNEAFASLGYSTDLGIEICHGFNLQFEGEALARAGVSQQVADFAKASLEIEAGVSAGVRIAAQLSPDVLDELGLTLSAQAYLKAYIRARLELSLTMSKILQRVQSKSNSIEYKIFKEFVSKLEVAAGIEANAEICIAAGAEVICRARLFDKENVKAGFDFRTNAEAGFLFGMGFDFFTKARFEDIGIFFRNSKTILIEELHQKCNDQKVLPKEESQFIFSTLSVALDLIIDVSTSDISLKKKASASTVKNYILDFLFDAGKQGFERFMEKTLEQFVEFVSGSSDVDNNIVDQALQNLQDIKQELSTAATLQDAISVMNSFIPLLKLFSYNQIDEVRKAATHIYAIGYLIDTNNTSFWKSIPAYAQECYREDTGQQITEFSDAAEAYLFIQESCLTDFLLNAAGETGTRIQDFLTILRQNGLAFGELIELLLDRNREDSQKKLINLLLSYLSDVFDRIVVDKMDNAVKPLFQRSELGEDYYDAIFEKSLNGFSSLFIPLLKSGFVEEEGDIKAAQRRLSYVANRFLLSFTARNITFFSNELFNHAVTNIEYNISTCQNFLRNGRFETFAKDFIDSIEDKINNILPFDVEVSLNAETEQELIQATEDFLFDTLDVAHDAMGRETWTEHRIAILSAAIEKLVLMPDGNSFDFNTLTSQEVEAKINEIMECDFLPDVPGGYLLELTEVLQAIGWKQFSTFLLEMPANVALYMANILKIIVLGVIREILDKIKAMADAFYQHLKELISDLEERIEELIDEIEQLVEDIEDLVDDMLEATETFIEDYFDALLGDLDFSDIGWFDDVIDFITFWDDDDSDEVKAKKYIRNLKNQALQNLDNQNRRTIINMALDHSIEETWLYDQVITDSLLDSLNEASFKTYGVVTEKLFEHNKPLIRIGNNLASKSQEHTLKGAKLNQDESQLTSTERKVLHYDLQYATLESLRGLEVQVNSPVPINLETHDTPIYNKYVYLEIDFGTLNIWKIIQNQIKIDLSLVVDAANNEIDPGIILRGLYWVERPNTPLINVKILLNGKDIPLEECHVLRDNKLSAHIAEPYLQQGINNLTIAIVTPSSHQDLEKVLHIQFLCDLSDKKYPSNGIYIDEERSVINSEGDDHLDARDTDLTDKEKVVITNGTEKEAWFEGWILEDAAGHQYEFGKEAAKPGLSYPIFVGEMPDDKKGWKASYRGRLIAILNNKGEFLKLSDRQGKVVSHIYTGNPKQNEHIHFIP